MAPSHASRCRLRRSVAPLTAASLAALTLLGCVDGDGRGWGEVRLSLTSALEVPASNVDAQGRWRTAHGFAVEAPTVVLEFDEVALSAADDAALPFDPATPPAGYSLCHGGHCHADDGSLPTYAEVAAVLAGADADAPVTSTTAAGDAALSLASAVSETALARCEQAPCAVARGSVGGARVIVHGVRLKCTVFAASTVQRGRLGETGHAIDVSFPVETTIATPMRVDFDRGEAFGQRVALRLVLGPKLLDGLPLGRWATEGGPQDATWAEEDARALGLALIHAATLEASVRPELP